MSRAAGSGGGPCLSPFARSNYAHQRRTFGVTAIEALRWARYYEPEAVDARYARRAA